MLRQTNNITAIVEPLRNVDGLDINLVRLELRFGKMLERVGGLPKQLLGAQVGIAKETAGHGIGNGPVLAAGKLILAGELHTTETTDLGPHGHLELDATGQKDLHIETPGVVTNNDVGIPLTELGEETAEQGTLVGHLLQLRHVALNVRVQITGELRHDVAGMFGDGHAKRTDEGQLRHVPGALVGGGIEQNVLMSDGRDGHDLVLVRLGVDDRLDLDGDGGDGRRGAGATSVALDEVETSDVLGIVNLAFELAPRDEGRGRLGILDADPARSHHCNPYIGKKKLWLERNEFANKA